MGTKGTAPIVLFAYNRPSHTDKTLHALMNNELANESILYIYCDGQKVGASNDQIQKINEVRKIASSKKWCKEVYIIESVYNKGLANSVIDGVTETINKHGKVIVLEDDLVTSKYFLKYLNSGLKYYENKKTVYSISADRPSCQKFEIPEDYKYDVFASLRPFSYGWATWKDRWDTIDWSLKYLKVFLNNKEQTRAFNRGGEDLTNLLILQRENKIDSWAIRFSFAHFSNHAVAILPCISYIDNIGYDGTGTHIGNLENHVRNDVTKSSSNPIFLDLLYEDRRIINSFYSSFYPHRRPILKKFVNRLSRIFGGKNVFVIKKSVYV